MEKFDALTKMKQLIEFLNHHTELYNAGKPEIADITWDHAYFELMRLEKEYPSLSCPDSPTKKVHYEVRSELPKVKHEYQPMLSLAKTKDLEEIKEFVGNRKYVAMLKLDGLTCRLTYKNGKLVRAETRGNGEEGEDITHNARVISSIPKLVPFRGEMIVDGEVICTNDSFAKVADQYANSRNYAAGSIRLLDSKECEARDLTFVAWDLIKHDADFFELSNKLGALESNNFIVVPHFYDDDFEEFDAIVESLKNIAELEGYPIDGLVFKWDDIEEYMAAGRTDHHFRGGMAYKFYDELYETSLRDIEWSMGRTGVLTPVAIYDPVNIDGAVCTRASLHNINTLTATLGHYPLEGQKIKVFRANQINPQIAWSQNVEDLLGADAGYFLHDESLQFFFPPKQCPVCAGATEMIESESGTIELHCSNDACAGKLINRLDHWAGKKGLDIKHLSKATLEKLIDLGWVTSIKDLYKLAEYRKEWIAQPGFGEKSVDRLLESIEESRQTTLSNLIAAMGIPLIGKTYAKQLARIFETYADFRASVTPDFISGITPFDFTQISGFGVAMHNAIVNFDYREFDRLVDMQYITFKAEEQEIIENANSLEGLTFVITGKLKRFKNRDLVKAEIEARGGKVVGTVSSKTTYLVNNDVTSTSAKNRAAKELRIPIISEEDLMNLF